jgi:two-component system cell cycle sensor histidine kinase/response regulator CckA
MQRNCLIADDEKLVRSYLKAVLQSCGFNVIEAEDGVRALEVVKALKTELHLLISDIQMPNMDGVTLVSFVRAELPELPVIFITGYSEYVCDGEIELIQKPFVPQTILTAITRVLAASAKSF